MDIFMEGIPQTVRDMGVLRDFRRMRQAELFASQQQKAVVLVMFSLVIPGPIKQNRYLEAVFDEGCTAFSALSGVGTSSIITHDTDRRPAGSTAFWLLHADAGRIKTLCTGLERTHLLGCLWDFDVFSAFERKLSAENIDFPPRTCLICTEPAKVCARSRKHSITELQHVISERVSMFIRAEGLIPRRSAS